MSDNGIMAIIMNINFETKEMLGRPIISTRGFVVVNENEELIKEIEKKASETILNKLKSNAFNYNDLKSELISNLSPFLTNKTGRCPIILPIIMEIKNN